MNKSMDLILCVEDDEDDAFILERAFVRAGIANPLVVVPGGKEAIEYLSGTGAYAGRALHPLPALVLLDLNMPGVSGLDVLKWIRATPNTATLVVIVLTSSSQDSDVNRAYIIGANGYLVKPTDLDGVTVMARAIKDYWLSQNRCPDWTQSAAANASNASPSPPGFGERGPG